ncbi:MAG: hypothetical protein H7X91_06150 [Burkholderiales bacterium]|nr:hypothetical protein [Burkholderiales bacterium]
MAAVFGIMPQDGAYRYQQGLMARADTLRRRAPRQVIAVFVRAFFAAASLEKAISRLPNAPAC